MVWRPDRGADAASARLPPMTTTLARGAAARCPACGARPLFLGYLTVTPECRSCHAPLGLIRADDVPPYFTILVVGHIVVPLMLLVERGYAPPMWLHAALWLPLTLGLTLLLLRPIKGATVGLMMKLGMMKPADAAN